PHRDPSWVLGAPRYPFPRHALRHVTWAQRVREVLSGDDRVLRPHAPARRGPRHLRRRGVHRSPPGRDPGPRGLLLALSRTGAAYRPRTALGILQTARVQPHRRVGL